MKKFPLLKKQTEIFKINSVYVTEREFKTMWTSELVQDIDIETELTALLSEQIYNEIEMNLRKFNIPIW